uniref:ATP synthase F0 subunit 8 n=1 Tax=Lopaphus albopunctatus TaxID=3050174 RepID=UPI0025A98C8A|nr:ATP synthase F0 subunit 8 [Lopaphus albopunctatus]WID87045.1 ATP synthase F0 subunit 8 [Lopaphus albopunctatus]
MPQMAPMSWMMIYLYITIIMIMFIIKIYFNKNNYMKININNLMIKNNKNWKW